MIYTFACRYSSAKRGVPITCKAGIFSPEPLLRHDNNLAMPHNLTKSLGKTTVIVVISSFPHCSTKGCGPNESASEDGSGYASKSNSGALEAQNRVMDCCGRTQMSRRGSELRTGGPVDQLSQIRIP
jgi:hypothetical protein